MNKQEMNAADIARAAKHASFALAAAPSNVRDNALLSVAAALRAKAGHIFAANEKDGRRSFRKCEIHRVLFIIKGDYINIFICIIFQIGSV